MSGTKTISDLCAHAISRATHLGLENAYVKLTLPREGKVGEQVPLVENAAIKSPHGEVVKAQNTPPQVLVRYDAYEVLAWMESKGLVKVGFYEKA